MILRKVMPPSLLSAGTAMAAKPTFARGRTYVGPHGATITHWVGPNWHGWHGWRPGPHWGPGPCCYGAGVAAGTVADLAVGAAVGVAAATRPGVAPPVVYAPYAP